MQGNTQKYYSKCNRKILIILAAFISILSACSPVKHLGENEYLLTSNKIKTSGHKADKSSMQSLIRQKPNKRILFFFRFHLGAYTLGNKIKRDNRLKRGLTKTIGEPPVIIDTLLIQRSASQIELFLNTKGHFNSEVNYELRKGKNIFNRKRGRVVYEVKVAKPYVLRNISYDIDDKLIDLLVQSTSQNTMLESGENYDEGLLASERDRLTNLIRSKGYYFFSRENISFLIDTNLRSFQYDIGISIPNIKYSAHESNDSLIKKNFKRHIIRRVHFVPDNPGKGELVTDTIRIAGSQTNYYTFTYEPGFEYNSKSMERFIYIKPGGLFDVRDVSQTFGTLSRLNNFKYTNMVFIEPDTVENNPGQNIGYLDCYIHYTRADKRGITTDTEVRNTLGSLGVAGNIGYTNRNIFKGAENFRLSANGAMEVQPSMGVETSPEGFLPFNTYEAGLNAKLDIPRFLIPLSQDRFPRYFKPKTTINTGYNYQKRPDYTRYVLNLNFGYDWQETRKKRHFLNPAEISSVKIFPTDDFIKRIEKLDPVIKNAYSDHLITATKYSFFYTSQDISRPRDFTYFRYNVEVAGNSVSLFHRLTNGETDPEEGKKLFNIRFAQYFRNDADIRYFKYFNPENILAMRMAVGYAHPYGNSILLPFEKSYFVGGANSIRAWNIRSLGPGGFMDKKGQGVDKVGDIILETSLEYRFPVYRIFKSAIFVDAGNVWLQKENPNFENGNFKFDRFYKEIAIGAGIGFRLDFSFFVIRTDFAAPVRVPKRPEDDRWVWRKTQLKDFNFNLGIGYPF